MKSFLHYPRIVPHVPYLARYRNTLPVLCPRSPVEIESVICDFDNLTVKQITANHCPRATFPRFAMNHRHVAFILRQPCVHVVAEGLDKVYPRRIVVIKWEYFYAVVELGRVVGSLRTQIIYLVVVLVFRIQHFHDVIYVVPVDTFYTRCRISHRDNLACYIYIMLRNILHKYRQNL